ncbi:MAG TPA: hypothetical protein VG498_08605 [Terriglobales bacterium]|nr:hypothetical protein [Terriglobales bacterium]
MAASTGQGRSFTTFLVGLTTACAGIAYVSTGLGKLLLAAGVLIFIVSMTAFLNIKPLEGKVAQNASPIGMKLAGALVSCFGWALVLAGLHVVNSTGGRIALSLAGIAVSLFGIVYILPAAYRKNAIWKS